MSAFVGPVKPVDSLSESCLVKDQSTMYTVAREAISSSHRFFKRKMPILVTCMPFFVTYQEWDLVAENTEELKLFLGIFKPLE